MIQKFGGLELADLVKVVPVGGVRVGEGVKLEDLSSLLLQGRVVAKSQR